MENSFFAMVSRMRYINRWALMRNTRLENIEEHSLQVAVVSHALALIRKTYFPTNKDGSDRILVDPNYVSALAIFHDTNEILTGDMPTPVKYFNSTITDAYKDIEKSAAKKLVQMLPEELACEYEKLLIPDTEDESTREAKAIVKAADKISALIKCVEEEKAGNLEFKSAAKKTRETIEKINLPEVKYFMENFFPSYEKTLDELES